jgi:hypothetical protein
MDHVRIFKELHSLACLLEDNGKFTESSKITNVMTRIAQVAPGNSTPGNPPVGNPPVGNAGTGATVEPTKDQLMQKAIDYNKNYLKEMLKLRDIAQYFLNQNIQTEYTYDKSGYVIKIGSKTYTEPTIEKLVETLNSQIKSPENKIKVPGALDNNKYIDEIAKNIASAADWPDPENDPTITKAINENYLLGYNLLGGTYYIQNKKNPSDVYDNKDINVLKTLFGVLGKYYKDNKNTFPDSIFEHNTTSKKKDGDINQIILEALRQDDGKMWAWINKNYSNHPNFVDIKRGFVQEYKRRKPDSKISMDNPDDTKNA